MILGKKLSYRVSAKTNHLLKIGRSDIFREGLIISSLLKIKPNSVLSQLQAVPVPAFPITHQAL
ncbi:hypothetical protein LOAG_07448, partial [Loa loa]